MDSTCKLQTDSTDSVMQGGCEGWLLGFKTTRQKGNVMKRMQVPTHTLQQKQRPPKERKRNVWWEKKRKERKTKNPDWERTLTLPRVLKNGTAGWGDTWSRLYRRGHCHIWGTLCLSLMHRTIQLWTGAQSHYAGVASPPKYMIMSYGTKMTSLVSPGIFSPITHV